MAEFEDQLNSLLSNPDAMAQIMQLAQSLGGEKSSPQQEAPPPPPSNSASGDLLASLSGGTDPSLMLKLLPLIQELGGQQDSHAR